MKKKFYITTSIVYTNASPHIGFTLELTQSDAIARYRRQKGESVFFLTGADEHGQKIYETAKKSGKSPKRFVNQISAEIRELTKLISISNDDFIRTTDQKRHWPSVFKLWKKMAQKGDIYKKKYQGLYCVGCERFYLKKELVNNSCPIHLTKPELIEEENYFFRLSKYSKIIEKKIKSNELKIVPEIRRNEMLSLLKSGLEDISFSRPKEKLPWGIPVPGDNSQIIYVWGDALTNYISGVGYGNKKESALFKKYWPANAHVIGKDILRFHAGIWPGMLMSAGVKLPKMILVHGFITYGGHKMSKSLGNVVSPFELIKKYGSEATRYYLLREIPTLDDGDYTKEKMISRYNADLAKGLGNFSARILTLGSKVKISLIYYKNKKNIDSNVKKQIEKTKKIYDRKFSEFKINEAVGSVWDLISFGDRYINNKKPWENTESKIKIILNLLFLLEAVGDLILPFLPKTSQKILKNINKSGKNLKITRGENLFPRLD